MKTRNYRSETYDDHFRLKVVAYHLFAVDSGWGMWCASSIFSIPIPTIYKWRKYFLDNTAYSEYELIRLGSFIRKEGELDIGGDIITRHF